MMVYSIVVNYFSPTYTKTSDDFCDVLHILFLDVAESDGSKRWEIGFFKPERVAHHVFRNMNMSRTNVICNYSDI